MSEAEHRTGSARAVRARAVEGLVCLGLAAGSLALAAAPGYDAWSWLQWGREASRLELATAGGPAFKPLPVAVTAVLAPAGGAAPELWLVVSRAASLLGVLVAGRLAWRLSGGSMAAGLAGGLGVVLCSGWLTGTAAGGAEGPVILLGLLAFERALARRPGQALALGFGAALLRPETWLFLGLYAAWVWRQERSLHRWMVVGAAAIPLCWLGPELLASGDPLRSGDRARVPNPGAPALAPRPALASLGRAAALALAPLTAAGVGIAVVGLVSRVRGVRAGRWACPSAVLALSGLAWVVLVAAMSEAGFSGEERYALPGAAALGVAGAAALGRLAAWVARRRGALTGALLTLAIAPFVLARADQVSLEWARAADAAVLAGDLEHAVAAAGGRAAVLACGRPFVGPYRGPLLAWHLDVPKARVGFVPRPPGVVFRSRLRRGGPLAPVLTSQPAFAPLDRSGRWQVLAACGRPAPRTG